MIALLLTLGALGAEPCTITLEGGVVHTDPAVAPTLDDPGRDCLGRVGHALASRTGLRTVTVVVEADDAARLDGSGQAVADAWIHALAEGGLPRARVSGVVKAGSASAATVAFSERRTADQVGTIQAVGGSVRSGPTPVDLAPVLAGTRLGAGTWVVTGGDGHAALALADGSRLRVRPDTALQVGQLHLDAALQRVVEVEVARGGVDLVVEPGQGRFDVRTPFGTAGVRGTVFRVSAGEEATRLETLEGRVALGGSGGEVDVAGGWGSSVDGGGAPVAPRELPRAPAVKGPLEGPLPARGLRWKGSRGAASWTVEVARDAEFVLEVRTVSLGERRLVPELPSGTWFWRVMAVDDEGYTGLPSKVYAVEVD